MLAVALNASVTGALGAQGFRTQLAPVQVGEICVDSSAAVAAIHGEIFLMLRCSVWVVAYFFVP